jgi:hypothetical protein
LPNGVCAASASITMSRSTLTFYSVPHRFARHEVEVRLTPQTIEIFLR